MSEPAYEYVGGHIFGTVLPICYFKIFTDQNDILPIFFGSEKTPKGRSCLHSRFLYALFKLKCDLGIAQFWIMGKGNGRLFFYGFWDFVLSVQIIDDNKS